MCSQRQNTPKISDGTLLALEVAGSQHGPFAHGPPGPRVRLNRRPAGWPYEPPADEGPGGPTHQRSGDRRSCPLACGQDHRGPACMRWSNPRPHRRSRCLRCGASEPPCSLSPSRTGVGFPPPSAPATGRDTVRHRAVAPPPTRSTPSTLTYSGRLPVHPSMDALPTGLPEVQSLRNPGCQGACQPAHVTRAFRRRPVCRLGVEELLNGCEGHLCSVGSGTSPRWASTRTRLRIGTTFAAVALRREAPPA